MKKLIYLVVGTIVLAASNVIMYNVGKSDGSNQEISRFLKEREYCNAVLEGLHKFYDTDIILWGKFMQTKEYQKIDSLNGGDWEDFYL